MSTPILLQLCAYGNCVPLKDCSTVTGANKQMLCYCSGFLWLIKVFCREVGFVEIHAFSVLIFLAKYVSLLFLLLFPSLHPGIYSQLESFYYSFDLLMCPIKKTVSYKI